MNEQAMSEYAMNHASFPDVRIRVARPADAAGIAALYAPFVRDSVVSLETDVPDAETMAARIAATLQTHPWLVAESAGESGILAGYAYAGFHRSRSAYRWSCEVSIYIAAEHRRRGLGRALYARLLGILRRQGYRNAWAGIALPNPASIALHEAMGFRPVGIYPGVGCKHGRWVDVGRWGLVLQEIAADTAPPPVPFARLGREG